MSNKTTIETTRLIIRGFALDDWRDLQEMIVQKEASEYAVYDHPWPVTEEKIKEIIGWFVDKPGYFAVCTVEPKMIGYILIIDTENTGEINMGYCFNEYYMGKGFASEACTAVLNYVFNNLKIEKVICNTAKNNGPSCRLLSRLGMKRVAELPGSALRNDDDGNPVTFVGVRYTITGAEWNRARNT
jgi:ribosomal-protein-alanine N-acetyltransferase